MSTNMSVGYHKVPNSLILLLVLHVLAVTALSQNVESGADSTNDTAKRTTSTNNSQELMSVTKSLYAGISISHPADWQVNEYSDHIDLLAPKDNSSNSFQTNISVYNFGPSQINDERELALYADNLIEDLKKNYSHFQLISSRNDSFKGFPAHLFEFTGEVGNKATPVHEQHTIIASKGNLFGVIVMANESSYTTHLPLFQRILDSLSLTESNVQLVFDRSKTNIATVYGENKLKMQQDDKSKVK